MPTHLHLVVLPEENVSLSNVMQNFKRFTSQSLSTQMERGGHESCLRVFARHAPEQAGGVYRVWQEGFHPEAIRSAEFAYQKIDYINNNPVRKGLVDSPEHWRYSSARNYALDDDSVMEIDRLEF
jgi:putative transposase